MKPFQFFSKIILNPVRFVGNRTSAGGFEGGYNHMIQYLCCFNMMQPVHYTHTSYTPPLLFYFLLLYIFNGHFICLVHRLSCLLLNSIKFLVIRFSFINRLSGLGELSYTQTNRLMGQFPFVCWQNEEKCLFFIPNKHVIHIQNL